MRPPRYKRRPFLTARWSDLLLLTFEAPEEHVRAVIPPGLEPDRWEGRCHVTLVAVRMDEVRVAGWRVPGFANHPQVNFRTYVRRPDLAAGPVEGAAGESDGSGVTFLRELVPSRLIAAVARLRYGEPFHAAAVEVHAGPADGARRVEYRFGLDRPRYRLAAVGSSTTRIPVPGTFEHHLIERRLGWRVRRGGRLGSFRVERDPWAVREVRAFDHDIDFAALYGAPWASLNAATPVSVIFAVGSDVAVH